MAVAVAVAFGGVSILAAKQRILTSERSRRTSLRFLLLHLSRIDSRGCASNSRRIGSSAAARDNSDARVEVTNEGVGSFAENSIDGEGATQEFRKHRSVQPLAIWQRKQTKARALGLHSLTKPTDGRARNLVESDESESRKIGSVGAKARWFPHVDEFSKAEGTSVSSGTVVELLDPLMSHERKQRIENVISNRTYSVCVVVEGLSDVGNVSAICRTADAMGFQSVHVISNNHSLRYRENHRTSAGAEKWLDMETYSDTKSCIKVLKSRGYRIAVTHIADDTVSIHDMDWTVPTAILLGNEHRGISEEALALSDVRCSIPMAGMVESFNVSVAAGIVMHHAVMDRISRMGMHGDLSEDEKNTLRAIFYVRHRDDTRKILEGLVKRKLE